MKFFTSLIKKIKNNFLSRKFNFRREKSMKFFSELTLCEKFSFTISSCDVIDSFHSIADLKCTINLTFTPRTFTTFMHDRT